MVDLLQEGANRERKAWRAKVRQIEKRLSNHECDADYNMSAADMVTHLLEFADKREKRTRKKKGGL